MSPTSPPKSTLGFAYHEHRDDLFKGVNLWLKDKRKDDGAEGLWRIHDDLYDLNEFMDRHPGGKMWLEVTKGTDITEAFEVHHISDTATNLLPKFHARKAKSKRASPYTFENGGFYRTLKRNIQPIINNVSNEAANRSNRIADCLMISTFFFACMSSYCGCYLLALIAGSLLCSTTIAGHNYFHRKDNFRMFYFDLSLMGSREWRISHALSHHLLTNTIQDLEISMFEPFFQYLPIKKGLLMKCLSWVVSPIVYATLFFVSFTKRVISDIHNDDERIRAEILIPFTIPLAMYYFGGQSILFTLFLWLVIITMASFQFGLVGVNAAHHHPDIFHDGDAPRATKIDWGIAQLDSVMDRTDITGSHYLVLTNFGDHALHHLFPTLDHGTLNQLYPIFAKTCKEFDIALRMTTQFDLVKGQFKQLLRQKPNPNKPGLDLDKYKLKQDL